MTTDIVVARFNEDIIWTRGINVGLRVVVYNKGEGSLRPLPNVGREAHTYLYHILDNYHSLADWTFFTQADISKHCPNLPSIVNKWPTSWHRSVLYAQEGLNFFASEPVRFLEQDPQGDDKENDVPGLWGQLFTESPPEDIVFSPAAIFAIHKRILISRSVAFYQKAYELAATRPRGAWEFERLWAYLWRVWDTPRY